MKPSVVIKQDHNICINCKEQIEKLTKNKIVKMQEVEHFTKPRRMFSFTIPVKMDNGSVRVFNAYRVQYNDALGHTKGGIRYHPELDLEEV